MNEDGVIDDREIEIIRDFIARFDIDKDGEVTTHDISIITEEFINNEYNIMYDILNKGQLDMKNLIVIKKLFAVLDLDHNERVNEIEIKTIVDIITKFIRYDINKDLIIDYKDLYEIISYVENNLNKSYKELYIEFINYIENNIKNISEEFYNYIINIVNTNIYDSILAIEYWYNEHKNLININNELLKEIYRLINELINFKTHDINNDNIINKNDIEEVTQDIKNYTGYNITYHVSSQIIIHGRNSNFRDDTISDIVPIN